MVKWAIHMFINRIKMAGWLLPSTLGGKFTQALFTIPNQRDLAHGLRINQGGLLRKGVSSESAFEKEVHDSCIVSREATARLARINSNSVKLNG